MRRIAVTGASGFIGSALTAYLRARGDAVVHLVRRSPTGPDEIPWDPSSGHLDPAALAGVDAVVHLAGAGVGDRRWTPAYKQLILDSRVNGTRAVAAAVAAADRPVRLVTASAIGYYGPDRGDETLTEASAPGQGFLAEVVRAWEGATAAAVEAGMPVAHARTGLVMSATGGMFPRLLRLTRFGLGGPMASGRQVMSWVSLPDTVRAYAFLVDHPETTGPVNLVGPDPRPQRDVAVALGRVVHRPAVVPAPAFALRIVLGEFAEDVLGSLRVLPEVLTDAGFEFEQASLEAAVAALA